jgi:S1-C subfamily serine protease
VQWGAYVTNVAANSPASQAGLQQGDIITQVGNVVMDANHSYLNTLYTYKPGDMIALQVIRNGKILQIQATLGEATHN